MTEIREELIPFDEEQLKQVIERLTQIYALVYGWEEKKGHEFKLQKKDK